MEAIIEGGVAVTCTKVVTCKGIEKKTVWKMFREGTIGLAPYLTDYIMESSTSSALEVTDSSCASVYSAMSSGVENETCSFPTL